MGYGTYNSIQINHFSEKGHKKTSYQNEFLQKIFDPVIMTTPIEHFDLEMKSRRSGCFLCIYATVYSRSSCKYIG